VGGDESRVVPLVAVFVGEVVELFTMVVDQGLDPVTGHVARPGDKALRHPVGDSDGGQNLKIVVPLSGVGLVAG
jgi:hypothetical protein